MLDDPKKIGICECCNKELPVERLNKVILDGQIKLWCPNCLKVFDKDAKS